MPPLRRWRFSTSLHIPPNRTWGRRGVRTPKTQSLNPEQQGAYTAVGPHAPEDGAVLAHVEALRLLSQVVLWTALISVVKVQRARPVWGCCPVPGTSVSSSSAEHKRVQQFCLAQGPSLFSRAGRDPDGLHMYVRTGACKWTLHVHGPDVQGSKRAWNSC